MNQEEMISFLSYLEKRYTEYQPLRQSYMDKEMEREKSGINKYGVGTPAEEIAIQQTFVIERLIQKSISMANLRELEESLTSGLENTEDKEEKRLLKKELAWISRYKEEKEKCEGQYR